MKELGRTAMDYGLLGMKMDRRDMKELGRMDILLLKSVGMKMGT
jgi:hypothetical protein